MTRADVVRAFNAVSCRAHDAALKRGQWLGHPQPDAKLMGVVRKLGNAMGHVKRARATAETRVDARGRRYGFAVDMAEAIVSAMDLCAALGVDVGAEVVAEVERIEERAKKTTI